MINQQQQQPQPIRCTCHCQYQKEAKRKEQLDAVKRAIAQFEPKKEMKLCLI